MSQEASIGTTGSVLRNECLQESIRLITEYLAPSHTDLDDESLSVRFAQICEHIVQMELKIEALEHIIRRLHAESKA